MSKRTRPDAGAGGQRPPAKKARTTQDVQGTGLQRGANTETGIPQQVFVATNANTGQAGRTRRTIGSAPRRRPTAEDPSGIPQRADSRDRPQNPSRHTASPSSSTRTSGDASSNREDDGDKSGDASSTTTSADGSMSGNSNDHRAKDIDRGIRGGSDNKRASRDRAPSPSATTSSTSSSERNEPGPPPGRRRFNNTISSSSSSRLSSYERETESTATSGSSGYKAPSSEPSSSEDTDEGHWSDEDFLGRRRWRQQQREQKREQQQEQKREQQQEQREQQRENQREQQRRHRSGPLQGLLGRGWIRRPKPKLVIDEGDIDPGKSLRLLARTHPADVLVAVRTFKAAAQSQALLTAAVQAATEPVTTAGVAGDTTATGAQPNPDGPGGSGPGLSAPGGNAADGGAATSNPAARKRIIKNFDDGSCLDPEGDNRRTVALRLVAVQKLAEAGAYPALNPGSVVSLARLAGAHARAEAAGDATGRGTARRKHYANLNRLDEQRIQARMVDQLMQWASSEPGRLVRVIQRAVAMLLVALRGDVGGEGDPAAAGPLGDVATGTAAALGLTEGDQRMAEAGDAGTEDVGRGAVAAAAAVVNAGQAPPLGEHGAGVPPHGAAAGSGGESGGGGAPSAGVAAQTALTAASSGGETELARIPGILSVLLGSRQGPDAMLWRHANGGQQAHGQQQGAGQGQEQGRAQGSQLHSQHHEQAGPGRHRVVLKALLRALLRRLVRWIAAVDRVVDREVDATTALGIALGLARQGEPLPSFGGAAVPAGAGAEAALPATFAEAYYQRAQAVAGGRVRYCPGWWRKAEVLLQQATEATNVVKLKGVIYIHGLRKELARLEHVAWRARLAYPMGLLLRGPSLRPRLVVVQSEFSGKGSCYRLGRAEAVTDVYDVPGFNLDGRRYLQLASAAVPTAAAAAGGSGSGAPTEEATATGGSGAANSGAVGAVVTASRWGLQCIPVQLWSAALPMAALTFAPVGGAGGGLPAAPPLRICRTPEAAAEAVDLVLLALRGPVLLPPGVPATEQGAGNSDSLSIRLGLGLNRTLAAYALDLEMVLPARGPTLTARLAAIRHSLAPVRATAAGGADAPGRPEPGMLRVRLGCGVCAACRDPWVTYPCLRPHLARPPAGTRFRRRPGRDSARTALRVALGWDPAATYRAAAGAVAAGTPGDDDGGLGGNLKRRRGMSQGQTAQVLGSSGAAGSAVGCGGDIGGGRAGSLQGATHRMEVDDTALERHHVTVRRHQPRPQAGGAGATSGGSHDDSDMAPDDMPPPGPRRIVQQHESDAGADSDTSLPLDARHRRQRRRTSGDIAASSAAAAIADSDTSSLDDLPLAVRCRLLRAEARRQRKATAGRRRVNIGKIDPALADGEVVPVAPPAGGSEEQFDLDGLVLDGQQGTKSQVASWAVWARNMEIHRAHEEDIRSMLVRVPYKAKVYRRHGHTMRRGHVPYGLEGLTFSFHGPAVAATSGYHPLGAPRPIGPGKEHPLFRLRKMAFSEPPVSMAKAAVTARAAGCLVALRPPLYTQNDIQCPWCGGLDHGTVSFCPFRRLCAPPLAALPAPPPRADACPDAAGGAADVGVHKGTGTVAGGGAYGGGAYGGEEDVIFADGDATANAAGTGVPDHTGAATDPAAVLSGRLNQTQAGRSIPVRGQAAYYRAGRSAPVGVPQQQQPPLQQPRYQQPHSERPPPLLPLLVDPLPARHPIPENVEGHKGPSHPRSLHHYSCVLGGGEVEPSFPVPPRRRRSAAALDSEDWGKVSYRSRQRKYGKELWKQQQQQKQKMPKAQVDHEWTTRMKQLHKKESVDAQLGKEGELPAPRGPPLPAWLASLDRSTLDLMAALDDAHPWANGLAPVHRIRRANDPWVATATASTALGLAASPPGFVDGTTLPVGGQGPQGVALEGSQGTGGSGAGDGIEAGLLEGAWAGARWEAQPSPEPLSCEMLLALALLAEEAAKVGCGMR